MYIGIGLAPASVVQNTRGLPDVSELTPEMLVSAYVQGYFPMDVESEILWFSPEPRTILPLDSFHVSKTLRQTCRNGGFVIRVDTVFEETMRSCANRPEGSWISDGIFVAYTELFRLGLAHSVEAWKGGGLAGGLYGVSIGGAFFGESMFHRDRDASKVALVALVERMQRCGFALLDVQWTTPHLRRFGAVEIPRRQYRRRLAAAIEMECDFVGPIEERTISSPCIEPEQDESVSRRRSAPFRGRGDSSSLRFSE